MLLGAVYIYIYIYLSSKAKEKEFLGELVEKWAIVYMDLVDEWWHSYSLKIFVWSVRDYYLLDKQNENFYQMKAINIKYNCLGKRMVGNVYAKICRWIEKLNIDQVGFIIGEVKSSI